jgi:hypothetical protein
MEKITGFAIIYHCLKCGLRIILSSKRSMLSCPGILMNILLLKLILSPIIIGSASLAGRKWGHAVSGWLIGLPMTSGPIMFFLALSHPTSFVMTSALGTLSGGFPLVAFCLVYAWMSKRFGWPASTAGSLLAYFALVVLMQGMSVSIVPLYGMDILAILVGIRLMPEPGVVPVGDSKPSRWDIPARIVIGTSFILLLTGSASLLGARLTGLLATIPLYTIILTVFTHRSQGVAGAVNVLRGLLFGLFAFASFFLALGFFLPHADVYWAFTLAAVTALFVQGCSLLILRQKKPGNIPVS